MSKYNYSFSELGERQARASATNISISTKQSIELSSFIRGKKLQLAKKYLEEIIAHKRALPMKRFNQEGTGHKKGKVGPGKYPEKTASAFHSLIQSVEANAKHKGLSPENLKIIHILANKGPQQPRYGRKRGVSAKRTHIEIVVEEKIVKKSKDKKQSKEETTKKKPVLQQQKQPDNIVNKQEKEKQPVEKSEDKKDIKKESQSPEVKQEKPKKDIEDKK